MKKEPPAAPGRPERRRTSKIALSAENRGQLRNLGGGSRAKKPVRRPSSEIVLSRAEIDFLRALSGRTEGALPPGGAREPLPPWDALLGTEEEPPEPASGQVVLPLTRPAAEWLDRLTREGYSFITPEERRARLILREKIHRAIETHGSDPGPSPTPRAPDDGI